MSMRSLYLKAKLDEWVRRAAAVEERAQRTPSQRPSERLVDVIESVNGGGGRARDTGGAFADALNERRRAL